ncbi:uncharacterized protein [Typha latifolia]|uniref:uncharacterized protein n=1 Tax=Typha latifolia TaxID=4733 RepID=UPI003C2F00F5
MEQSLRKYDRECMKMAMLKHEETFRQQVHELHRLYRVQKLLMRNMKNKELKERRMPAYSQSELTNWNGANNKYSCNPGYRDYNLGRPSSALNLDLPADEYIGNAEEDIELELTLGIGGSGKKREGTPFTSDSGASFSSSSTESGGLMSHEWGLHQVRDVSSGFPYERTMPYDVGEGVRQDGVKQPAWFFQCLSLKMT